MNLNFVLVDVLGICENCNRILSVEEFAGEDTMNANWSCSCGAKLDHESFGYDKGGKGCKKVRWVGPESKWVDSRPASDFTIGNLDVILQYPSFVY